VLLALLAFAFVYWFRHDDEGKDVTKPSTEQAAKAGKDPARETKPRSDTEQPRGVSPATGVGPMTPSPTNSMASPIGARREDTASRGKDDKPASGRQRTSFFHKRRSRMWGWGSAFHLPRAMRRECNEDGGEEQNSDLFAIESGQLVEEMGLSGMCVLSPKVMSGISGLPLSVTLPALSLQAWLLQGIILYYMTTVLTPREDADVKKTLPTLIIFAAVYLHFLQCVRNFPYSISVLGYLFQFHETLHDRVVAVPIFLVDAIFIPIGSLIIGALYLCTSRTVADVILNSCAVAFTGEIDDWILTLNARLNALGRKEHGSVTIYMPIPKSNVMMTQWLLSMVPVVPSIFALSALYVGIDVMKL
jgi:hypothetical protein